MRKTILFLAVLFLAGNALGQSRRDPKSLTEGFYASIGVVDGPEFSSFVNYVNDFYRPLFSNNTDRLDKFGKAPIISLGYLLRLYPSFALDVGFSIYSLKTEAKIRNFNSPDPEAGIRHKLEYQVGIFSATVPVLFDFSPKQPVVPYVGIGVSIFAMRLDDIKEVSENGSIVIGSRDTGTNVGGHFETGLYAKISRKIWIDLQWKWHNGSGNLRAQEPGIQFEEFKIDQDLTQINAGVVYFFR